MRRITFMAAVAAVLVLATSFVQQAHGITFDDGMVHVIDAGSSFPAEPVIVQDRPGDGATTTLNLVEGGQIGTATSDDLQ